MEKTFTVPPDQIGTLLALARSGQLDQFVVTGISFRGADLRGRELAYFPLSGIDLELADLANASLQGANCSDALLRRANLRDALCVSADLSSADLREADLRGTNLESANLTAANLTGALYDSRTKWPEAFNVQSSGAVRHEHSVSPQRPWIQRWWPQTSPNRYKEVANAAAARLPRWQPRRPAVPWLVPLVITSVASSLLFVIYFGVYFQGSAPASYDDSEEPLAVASPVAEVSTTPLLAVVSPVAEASTTPLLDAAAACDPAYPSVCIPPYPPDLGCGEIPYSSFQVIGDDPHGFDGNKNGIGCESDTATLTDAATSVPTPSPTLPENPSICTVNQATQSRSGPSADYPVWRLLPRGAKVMVVGFNNVCSDRTWYHLRRGDWAADFALNCPGLPDVPFVDVKCATPTPPPLD